MPTDLFEIKLGAYGIRLNVIELCRRMFNQQPPGSRVGTRFLDLFHAHGVAPEQIQRFLPQVTLEHLAPERLGAVLTNETLNQAAALFGVRREWLEGVDQQIYEPVFCYKAPGWFFEDLTQWQIKPQAFAVRALCCGELDNSSSREQPLALLTVETVGVIGDNEICRYRVYHDAWDWGHFPCRLQLKAIARLVHLGWQTPIPVHRVQRGQLERIRAGRRVPRSELQGCPLSEPCLEDFALAENESGMARETEELEDVFRYIDLKRLSGFALEAGMQLA
jgi:hypothetical protein